MVPFIAHHFQIFAPARVGHLSGYAHVDTGARRSFTRQRFGAGFPRVGEGRVKGAIGATAVPQCRVPLVSLFGEDFLDLMVDVLPDSTGDFGHLDFPVILTAGVDVLYHKPLYIDFLHQRIGFVDPVPHYLEGSSQVVDLTFALGFAFFKLQLGEHELRAMFDTGAGYSVLHARWLDTLRGELIEQAPEEATDPAGGRAIVPVYRHASLAINGIPLGGGRFLVVDLEPVEKLLGTELDFVLGFDTMVGHNWLVDQPRQRLLRLPVNRQ